MSHILSTYTCVSTEGEFDETTSHSYYDAVAFIGSEMVQWLGADDTRELTLQRSDTAWFTWSLTPVAPIPEYILLTPGLDALMKAATAGGVNDTSITAVNVYRNLVEAATVYRKEASGR